MVMTLSMQIFNFQKRSCKLSFLFPPRRQSGPESLLAGYYFLLFTETILCLSPSPPPPLPSNRKKKKERKLHNHCFHFLLGITVVPREVEDGGHAEFWE